MGMLDMLLDQMPPELREALATIQDADKRAAVLKQITDPLQELARIQGAMAERLTSVENQNHLILATLWQMNPTAYETAEALLPGDCVPTIDKGTGTHGS